MPIVTQRELAWLGSSTRVVVGSDLLFELPSYCRKLGAFPSALVVTDEQLPERYSAAVATGLKAGGFRTHLGVVPAGDASKSLEQVSRLYDQLATLQMGRDGLIVGVGGGMVTDLAGFVGSTWMRGVATALCPTTMEADIDAAIGGKTGINHPAGKNLIGAFHHPRLVVIDTDCLATLPDRDFSAGLAESVKHAAISDEAFLEWHEAHASELLERRQPLLLELVDRNVATKAEIVARDEREERGIREVLNLGHTVGHAIEAACGYRLRHGECVALGMVAECHLSMLLGSFGARAAARLVALLRKLRLPVRLSEAVDVETVLNHLRLDKKSALGKPRFALLEGFGRPVIRSDIPAPKIIEAIESIAP